MYCCTMILFDRSSLNNKETHLERHMHRAHYVLKALFFGAKRFVDLKDVLHFARSLKRRYSEPPNMRTVSKNLPSPAAANHRSALD